MPLTTAGRTALAQAIINDSPVLFTNANARLGVGDSSTAFAVGQTDLVAASNKFRKAMETGYPLRSGATLTFRSIFLQAEANFTWNEWGVFNAASAGTMLSRKVENLGTKDNTQSWVLTVDITFSA
jgi:hypothetical protein